jgi:hypothetical protein
VQPVCIEFIDTVEPREGPVVRDALTDYAGLVNWARRVGLQAPDHPEDDQAFRSAIELREALFVLLLALAEDTPPPAEAVAALHRHYVKACASGQLEITAGAVTWHWPNDPRQVGCSSTPRRTDRGGGAAWPTAAAP